MADKKADLAGPGIGDYHRTGKSPAGRTTARCCHPKRRRRRLFEVKRYIEDNLCKELNLMMVEVPLIVDEESGVNDLLDRDGSRTPIQFHISNDHDKHPINAQVVQAATKWKRMALKQFGMQPGEGLCTDMRAVRKDYFLDHDHSAYVDQWDWERVMTPEQRNLDFLKDIVSKIWKVMVGAERYAQQMFPALRDPQVSQPAGADDVPACGRNSRHVSRPAAQTAGDGDPAEVSGGLHHRDWLDAEGRLSARAARGRL